jgi:RNA polymerase sigma-70 factor (ECF subfamily)
VVADMAAVSEGAPEQPSVPALIAAARAGDRLAEGALVARFAAAVRTYARRRLKAADAVDEFAQDVFLRLVQAVRAGAIAEPERAGGFVLGICKNVARERARLAERRAELWAQFGDALAPLEDAPELARYQLALLEDCLSQISQRSRDVIKHAFVHGESAAEIGTRLEMSEGNVRVVRHRALEALRSCMSGKVSWEGAS